jgi:hypothetical protein
VYVDARPRDTGVVVLGSKSNDDLVFSRDAHARVVVTKARGRPLYAEGLETTSSCPTIPAAGTDS